VRWLTPGRPIVGQVTSRDSRQLAAELPASRPQQGAADPAQLGREGDEPPDVLVGDVAEDADRKDDVGGYGTALGVDTAGVDRAHLHPRHCAGARGGSARTSTI